MIQGLPTIMCRLRPLSRVACVAAWLVAGAACTTEARLRESGPTPYVRCMSAPPAADRTAQGHGLRLSRKGAVITVVGAPKPLHLAVFSGPGFGPAPSPADLAGVASSGADLFVMLGGLGDSQASASATAAALAKLPAPLLFVAGGRDSLGTLAHAFASLPANAALLDATAVHEIHVGSQALLPIAGAQDGRYSVDEDSCGFGLPDLKARAGQLAAIPGRRWLLAWQAPAGAVAAGVGRTATGLDLGSGPLAEFARRASIAGGLYAWPEAQIGLAPAGAASAVVPRLFGPLITRTDGSRSALGFLRAELDNAGLRVVR